MPQVKRWSIPILLFSIISLFGCSINTEPSTETSSNVNKPVDVVRPIDDYLPSAQQILGLFKIQISTISKCLADKGDVIQPKIPSDAEYLKFAQASIGDRILRSKLWGFFDTKNVNEFGYARPTDQLASVTINFSGATQENLESCQKVGEQKIGGYSAAKYSYEDSLPQGGPPLAINDNKLKAASAAWSECMNGLGISGYTNPILAVSDPQWISERMSSGSTASEQQIRVAKSDIQCKKETNFMGVALSAQIDADRIYINENRSELEKYKINIENLLL